MFDQGTLKSDWWPLALLWLAVHAVILSLILGVKFLSAKTIALLFLVGTVAWFLLGRRRTASLPPPPSVV